jgi:hypothetical protein
MLRFNLVQESGKVDGKLSPHFIFSLLKYAAAIAWCEGWPTEKFAEGECDRRFWKRRRVGLHAVSISPGRGIRPADAGFGARHLHCEHEGDGIAEERRLYRSPHFGASVT